MGCIACVWVRTVHPNAVFAFRFFKSVWLCVVLKEDGSSSNRDVQD